MEMVKFDQRDDTIINQLMDIWENSVRATHLFLKEEDILRITEYVPQELTQIPVLIAAKKDGRIVGFMGIDQDRIGYVLRSDTTASNGFCNWICECTSTSFAS